MREFIDLVNEMSPYLLLGFLFAGLLHAFVPRTLYSRYLSANNFRSVFLAALFGIPLPLCSCGVLPTAMSLRREGASEGATISFLTATPQTGVDSIMATYALMGLPFAIIRPIAALVTAMFGGLLANRFSSATTPPAPKADTCACESGCGCDGGCHTEETTQPQGFWARLMLALRYAFVDMMADIGKWLIIGLIVAGLITVLVPEGFMAQFSNNSFLSIGLVLLISIPMYICATGSIPIAAALMLKGLSPGAALVLLMAGPACNVASILVVNKVMGRRTTALYLLSIILGSVAFALIIDHALPREWFVTTATTSAECCHPETPWLQWASTTVLSLLLANAFILRPLLRRFAPQPQELPATARRFRIAGMTCNHCRMSAEKALASVKGVEKASVSLEDGIATIEGTASETELRTAVEALGFEFHPTA